MRPSAPHGEPLPVHRTVQRKDDALHLICRAAETMAEVAQQALHEDPRYRDVWLRAADRPGQIEIGGRVADSKLLALLRHFADEWGGIDLTVQIGPADAERTVALSH